MRPILGAAIIGAMLHFATVIAVPGDMVNFTGTLGIQGPLGNLPIYETTLAIILVIGALYFFAAQRMPRPMATIKPAEAPAV